MGRLLVSFAVTPYGGVWIEMRPGDMLLYAGKSRLMEACGLKLQAGRPAESVRWSRLMEACGLK